MRKPKAGLDEGVDHERGIDGNQELFKAGVLKRGDGKGFAVAREVCEVMGRDEIDLVQNLDDRLGRDRELGQDFFDLSFLLVAHRAGGVLHVEKNLSSLHLFEGGTEASNQCVGKVADESSTVSDSKILRREGSCSRLSLGSSVANIRADSSTPASVSALKRVLLPALV